MAILRFAKLHGTANDFVYVDARAGFPGDPAALAPRLCDRRRGIGADGLILLESSAAAVAAARTGRGGRRVVVALRGGELEIDWRPDDRVLMTGDAVEVFEGQVEV